MQLNEFKCVVGCAATTAVTLIACAGTPTMPSLDIKDLNEFLNVPSGATYDYYQVQDIEHTDTLSKIEVVHRFASTILENIEDLEPEFSKTVDENFWDLI